jgi:hypothetical protein
VELHGVHTSTVRTVNFSGSGLAEDVAGWRKNIAY